MKEGKGPVQVEEQLRWSIDWVEVYNRPTQERALQYEGSCRRGTMWAWPATYQSIGRVQDPIQRKKEETRIELEGKDVRIKATQELHLIELRKKNSELKDVCESLVVEREKSNVVSHDIMFYYLFDLLTLTLGKSHTYFILRR